MHTTPGPTTKIDSSDELTEAWTHMMGTGGFGRRTLWVIFFDRSQRLDEIVMPIDELPIRPEHRMMITLSSVLTRTLDEQRFGSAAFLLSRPGARQMTAEDRAWARALVALDDERLRRWPVHLATRNQVRVFAPDDLLGAA